ncbi:MAG TPA: PfkB family carbohydrate kinase [Candidatus Kapabacteria bacterium]|nr:PfkB family carbohydrate kinase [Candidatus Kapabacteria bacterium]
MSVLVVGTLAVDTLETPFAVKERALGGSATYISLAANYFVRGESISVVSVVGEDFPAHGWKLLRERKFDLDGVEVVKGGKTFFWHGKYHYDMNTRDTLVTELNVLADFKPNVPAHAASPDFLVLGNLGPDVQLSVIGQLKTKPKLIVLDTMNFWITGTHERLLEALKKANALVINDSEARLLVENPSLIVCGRTLQEMLSPDGTRIVIIKKGEHGALLFYDDKFFSAPSYPLEDIFDPTGAGDTFMGGFVGYLAKRGSTSYEDAKRAVIYGTVLASFCCSKFSTEAIENLTMNEIYERFLQLRELSAFEEDIV